MLSRRYLPKIASSSSHQSLLRRSLQTIASNSSDVSLTSTLLTIRKEPQQPSQQTPNSSFDILVEDLCSLLSRSSGHQASQIDHKELQMRMLKYKTNRAEWAPYALEDPGTNYTRNLIDRPGGWANLVRLSLLVMDPAGTDKSVAFACLEAWHRKCRARSCRLALCHEGVYAGALDMTRVSLTLL
jgi:hypothetical protein